MKIDVVSAFNLVQDYNTFIHERLLSTRVARVALSLSLQRTLVGGRRFRPSAAVVGGRRLRPNFGHLEFIFGYSNHRNSRSKPVRTSFLHIDAVALACTFPRPFVVVDYNQFYTARKSSTDLEKT